LSCPHSAPRNETFEFYVVPSTPKIYVSIFDHKTLGKDKSLGEAEVDVCNLLHHSLTVCDSGRFQIWQHIQPPSNSAADVSVEIANGHGFIRLRLSLGAEPIGRKSSVDQSGAGTLTSPSRFSLRGRRPGAGLDKEE
jgi:C2 domain